MSNQAIHKMLLTILGYGGADQKFIDMAEGLEGLGIVDNYDIPEYLTKGQVRAIVFEYANQYGFTQDQVEAIKEEIDDLYNGCGYNGEY